MRSISIDALAARVATGTVVVVEALSADFYACGHVPGSVNLPVVSSDSRIAAFVATVSSPVAVYGSRDGGEARELARRIEAAGNRDVLICDAGKESWVEAGHALERSPD